MKIESCKIVSKQKVRHAFMQLGEYQIVVLAI